MSFRQIFRDTPREGFSPPLTDAATSRRCCSGGQRRQVSGEQLQSKQ